MSSLLSCSIAKYLESANTMFSSIWLYIVFLVFYVFFVVFYVALACIIGIVVCCCLPCIIAILYVGASEDDIRQIPKYKFQKMEEPEKQLECCICISAYDDGAKLCELPCGHHFHCICINKWLRINVMCPLCQYNVPKNTSSSGSEEV
ncbi:hypothetical protein BDA96_04G302800 [Sorghum bicolor]|uniref:RING-type E3 ubiquitin transferase n=2 Tax=Sorghum bicolor TaxID=4558 RepID=A0A921R7N2_SORBI|nr:hypothetical protein BDA96_04G302800 [Sorghum bicolor]KXG31018.1 hypothetical protein SORBI_3004G284100 [Sorghum bicolor]